MQKITHKKLLNMLRELLSCSAFELHKKDTCEGSQDVYIPYMMNDALECYLLLRNTRMTGHYLPDFKGETSVEFVEAETVPALIFRQGSKNVFTLWFEDCFQVLKCYRYDQIGHFWVNGAQHWRRLVYMIGTIYDKYEYMGEEVCNPEEITLLPLMEFAPFRYYSPIHESLDEHYENSLEGLDTMVDLAKEADDHFFLWLLKIYRLFPGRLAASLLARSLNHPARSNLYQLLHEKVSQASMKYPERSYSEELNQEILFARNQVAEKLKAEGFSGEYPLFHKEGVQIFAAEEHPFTILDWEHYSFRIQFMISETLEHNPPLHYGFFKKRGNNGHIEHFDYNYFIRN